jgi:hypothetical protein
MRRVFPDDLRYAVEICGRQNKELSCSVIWPGHVQTFGDVGIVLVPRSTDSVSSVSPTDSGTVILDATGGRDGNGSPFSAQSVSATFRESTGYNEWTVKDAETVGIFVCPKAQLQIAKRMSIKDAHGYDPAMDASMDSDDFIGSANVTPAQVAEIFSYLPVYTIAGEDILMFERGQWIKADVSVLYK